MSEFYGFLQAHLKLEIEFSCKKSFVEEVQDAVKVPRMFVIEITLSAS